MLLRQEPNDAGIIRPVSAYGEHMHASFIYYDDIYMSELGGIFVGTKNGGYTDRGGQYLKYKYLKYVF